MANANLSAWQKYIPKLSAAQRDAISKFFGQGLAGAEDAFAGKRRIPWRLKAESAAEYIKTARAAIEAGRDKTGLQLIRIEALRRWLPAIRARSLILAVGTAAGGAAVLVTLMPKPVGEGSSLPVRQAGVPSSQPGDRDYPSKTAASDSTGVQFEDQTNGSSGTGTTGATDEPPKAPADAAKGPAGTGASSIPGQSSDQTSRQSDSGDRPSSDAFDLSKIPGINPKFLAAMNECDQIAATMVQRQKNLTAILNSCPKPDQPGGERPPCPAYEAAAKENDRINRRSMTCNKDSNGYYVSAVGAGASPPPVQAPRPSLELPETGPTCMDQQAACVAACPEVEEVSILGDLLRHKDPKCRVACDPPFKICCDTHRAANAAAEKSGVRMLSYWSCQCNGPTCQ